MRLTRFAVTLGIMAASAAVLLSASVSTGPLEITSLLGRPLYALPDDGSIQSAQQKFAADPKKVELAVALSKAQAGRRQYKEAVAADKAALAFAPDNAELLLELGHRELGLRMFADAQRHLEKATQINPNNLDEFYHLGLAHYFQRDFPGAASSFQKALDLAQSNDSVIDCSNWLYVSLRRAGQKENAAKVLERITPSVQNKEPHLLFYLKLLHFYQGKATEAEILPHKPASPADVEAELSFDTTTYGVGNWHLYNGDSAAAMPMFRSVVSGDAWNAWGFIGSEVELAQSHRQPDNSGRR